MLALTTPRAAHNHPEESAFLAAMADAPGCGTSLLVFADWLDEYERFGLAAAIRDKAAHLVKRYQQVAACLDVLLSIYLERVQPVGLPAPDRGVRRSKRQWCAIVRAAIHPFGIPGLTFAVAPGWHGGPDVELRLPNADFAVADGRGDVLLVPWGLSSHGLLHGAAIVFGEIMPRLFPSELPRDVHYDGETFLTHFWRVAIRPQT